MTASFAERLRAAVEASGSCLCVGLDPDPARLAAGSSVREFCLAIVEATAGMAAAFKPNLAFFEALGAEGWDILHDVCQAVRATDRLLILDGKRGDIGTTGDRYAVALYDRLGGDAATVAPYMGRDSIAPFLKHEGRAAFVLVATSNPGATDVQALRVDGTPLFQHVARLAVATGAEHAGEVGFVVGATRPALLGALRLDHPEVPFLVPGVGAQGGSVADLRAANAGGPMLVNASRSILYAGSGAKAPRAAAEAARALAAMLLA